MKILFIIPLIWILSCVSKPSSPENFSRINKDLYFGGSPEENDFAFLKAQGVKSIICVDGAKPDLKSSKAQNILYRHVPVTYDELGLEQQKMLVKAYDELPKPVYIHCHHGKHRGPAAVAIILKNHHDWKNDSLIQFMEKAGTSKHYNGLYQSVSESKKLPQKDWQKLHVPESAKVKALARTMAELDRIWVRLENELRKEMNTAVQLSAQNDALLLKEYFVELKREEGTKFDKEYAEIIDNIKLLELSLSRGQGVSKAFEAVKTDCKSCHSDYRD